MEQTLFGTAEIARELEHKSKNPRRDVLNIAKRLGFTPVATRPREGKTKGGSPEMLWSREQKDAILDDNLKRYKSNGNNIQDARADVTDTADNAATVAPSTAQVTDISTVELAPVVITLDERANRIRSLQADVQRGIIEIGNELLAAKKEVGHGGWGEWLKIQFDWTQQTANRFMRVAERFCKLNNVAQFKPSILQAMLLLPEGTEQEFIDAQANSGTPIEKQSARDVQKNVKAFKAARATPKETAEEPTPVLSNRGETDKVTHEDRPVVSEPVDKDSAKQEETNADDVAQFVVVTPQQLIALRELVTTTNDLQTLKAIHDSLLELAQEFGKVVLLTEAKIGELAQKK